MSSKSKLIKIALDTLKQESLTLCLYDGHTFYKSIKRGVVPLVELINQNKDYSQFISVDKVIGKAAAFLYVNLNIKDVYCITISEHALKVFIKYKINVVYENLVPAIRNRSNDGYCPMETLVLNVNDPKEALDILINK